MPKPVLTVFFPIGRLAENSLRNDSTKKTSYSFTTIYLRARMNTQLYRYSVNKHIYLW